MKAYKKLIRSALRLYTQTSLPGRYLLVEALRPIIVEKQRMVIKTAQGPLMDLDLSDIVQRQLFFNLYEREDLDLLSRLVNKGDTVFDIGGNIGYFTVCLAQSVGEYGKVHTFEPVPSNVEQITRNVALNSFQGRVVVNPVGVSSHESTIELFTNPYSTNTGSPSIVPSDGRPNRISVPSYTIDSYIRQNGIGHVALIKMDIEGSEFLALQGMHELLTRGDPIIYFEINPWLLNRLNSDPTEIKRYISGFGYLLYAIDGGSLKVVREDEPESKLRNILASKKPLNK